MLEHMKKQNTNKINSTYKKLFFDFGNQTYSFSNVPNEKVHPFLELLKKIKDYEDTTIAFEKSLAYKKRLHQIGGVLAYRKSALMVKGARNKEEITQKELAKKLNILQTNLSMIENAKRPIGKKLAHKLEKVFNISYKVFLSDLPN